MVFATSNGMVLRRDCNRNWRVRSAIGRPSSRRVRCRMRLAFQRARCLSGTARCHSESARTSRVNFTRRSGNERGSATTDPSANPGGQVAAAGRLDPRRSVAGEPRRRVAARNARCRAAFGSTAGQRAAPRSRLFDDAGAAARAAQADAQLAGRRLRTRSGRGCRQSDAPCRDRTHRRRPGSDPAKVRGVRAEAEEHPGGGFAARHRGR